MFDKNSALPMTLYTLPAEVSVYQPLRSWHATLRPCERRSTIIHSQP